MRKLCAIPTFFLLILFLPGCGGGDGGTTTIFPLATRTALIHAGNTWTYTATGSGTANGNPVTVSGTLVISIVQTTISGQSALAETLAFNGLLSNGQPFTTNFTFFIVQDPATGKIAQVGITPFGSTTPLVLTTPLLSIPATWSPSASFDTQGSFTDGSTLHRTFTILGSEVVNTPAGHFTTWKVTDTDVTTQGGIPFTSVTTYWFAPEMGHAVQNATTVASADHTVILTFTTKLSSTNVPLR